MIETVRDSILEDLFVVPDEDGVARQRKPRIQDRVVRGVVSFVEAAGVLDVHEAHLDEDRPDRRSRGGRPAKVLPLHILTVRLMLADNNDPASIRAVHEVLRHRLSDDARLLLDLPLPGSPAWRRDWQTLHYSAVADAFRRFALVYDPKACPAGLLADVPWLE